MKLKHSVKMQGKICSSNYLRNLEVTRFHSFIDEVESPFTEDISVEFFEPESSVQWYIAVRSAEMFRTKNSRYPGEQKDNIDSVPLSLCSSTKLYLHFVHTALLPLGSDSS